MSKPLVVSIPHELGRAQARARIERGFSQLGDQFGGGDQVARSWTGDRLSFVIKAVGQVVTGNLDVRDDHVLIEVTLPGVLGLIAGKIKNRLQAQGQLLLEKK